MRRSSHVARTVALGIIADDIFGALMNASSSGYDAMPPAWMIADRPEARRPGAESLIGNRQSPIANRQIAQ